MLTPSISSRVGYTLPVPIYADVRCIDDVIAFLRCFVTTFKIPSRTQPHQTLIDTAYLLTPSPPQRPRGALAHAHNTHPYACRSRAASSRVRTTATAQLCHGWSALSLV